MTFMLDASSVLAWWFDGATDPWRMRSSIAWGTRRRSHRRDAVYLDLAATRGVPLATVDEQLRAACAMAGVALAG